MELAAALPEQLPRRLELAPVVPQQEARRLRLRLGEAQAQEGPARPLPRARDHCRRRVRHAPAAAHRRRSARALVAQRLHRVELDLLLRGQERPHRLVLRLAERSPLLAQAVAFDGELADRGRVGVGALERLLQLVPVRLDLLPQRLVLRAPPVHQLPHLLLLLSLRPRKRLMPSTRPIRGPTSPAPPAPGGCALAATARTSARRAPPRTARFVFRISVASGFRAAGTGRLTPQDGTRRARSLHGAAISL